MALKAIIHKAQIELADIDRGIYRDDAVTVARHPSETDERLMVRLLAFAVNPPRTHDEAATALEFAKDMWDPEEPALWRRDRTGRITHWIDVGQPDERRLLRASSRVDRLGVYAFGSSVPIWWRGVEAGLTRLRNLDIWQISADQSRSLATLAGRTMQLQVTVQNGSIWVGNGTGSVEVTLRPLRTPAETGS